MKRFKTAALVLAALLPLGISRGAHAGPSDSSVSRDLPAACVDLDDPALDFDEYDLEEEEIGPADTEGRAGRSPTTMGRYFLGPPVSIGNGFYRWPVYREVFYRAVRRPLGERTRAGNGGAGGAPVATTEGERSFCVRGHELAGSVIGYAFARIACSAAAGAAAPATGGVSAAAGLIGCGDVGFVGAALLGFGFGMLGDLTCRDVTVYEPAPPVSHAMHEDSRGNPVREPASPPAHGNSGWSACGCLDPNCGCSAGCGCGCTGGASCGCGCSGGGV